MEATKIKLKPKLTNEEMQLFVKRVKYYQENFNHRLGEACWHALAQVNYPVCEQITRTPIDPYWDDSRVSAFCFWLLSDE